MKKAIIKITIVAALLQTIVIASAKPVSKWVLKSSTHKITKP